METDRFVEVVLAGFDGRFHYHLPPALAAAALVPGIPLWVPFGPLQRIAYFVREVTAPGVGATKPVIAILSDRSPIPPALFESLLWLSDYYAASLGDVLETALPQGVRPVAQRILTLTDAGRTAIDPAHPAAARLFAQATMTAPQFQSAKIAIPPTWIKRGWVTSHWEVPPPPTSPAYQSVSLPDGVTLPTPRGAQQKRIVQMLQAAGGTLPIDAFESALRPSLRRLAQQEVVQIKKTARVFVPPAGFAPKGVITLNPAQQKAADEITAALGQFTPFLLHGVTGSGKTEVYLVAIEAALARGQSAILLVPEIGLTVALVARLHERFGSALALLHSRRSPSERFAAWQRLQDGGARLAVGARSALFAPLANVGVIIVDEEHDPSYKQDEGVRYHARDMALVRGRMEGAVVLLGSATPSIESFHNAEIGKYRTLRLMDRVEARPMPTVRVVDLRLSPDPSTPYLSQALMEAITERLARSEQTLLLVNRRGFSPCLLCQECGHVPSCIQCSVSLTYHRADGRLLCHHCGYEMAPLACCAQCRGVRVIPLGIGTQQVEAQIRTRFPTARIARMDRDTTQKKDAHHDLLAAMAAGEIDILIGTQMIAKGHDFPNVTLVGVICADLSFHFPDFRAGERAFQLLAQAAGRAGRGSRLGEVLIQTFQPEHTSVQAAATQDDIGFYQREIAARREGEMPPFCRLILLRLSHPDEAKLQAAARHLARQLGQIPPGIITLLGPAPAPIVRLRGRYFYHLLLKVAGRRSAIEAALNEWKAPEGLRWSIDIDPQRFS